MDEIVAASPVPVERNHVYVAAELLHLISRILDLPLCEYRQAVILLRQGQRWVGIDTFLDCDRLQRRLKARIGGMPQRRWEIALRLAIDLLFCARFSRLLGMARLGFQALPLFLRRWDYAAIPATILPLNAGTTCDRFNLDLTVAERCEKTFYTQQGEKTWKEPASRMWIRHLRERLRKDAATASRSGDAAASANHGKSRDAAERMSGW